MRTGCENSETAFRRVKVHYPCERAAAVVAQQLVRDQLSRAQRVDLERVQRDKYFRILADVRADGESVAQMLISQGLAYPYNGGTKQRIDWCAR